MISLPARCESTSSDLKRLAADLAARRSLKKAPFPTTV
ncbi:hypothetical protein Shel_27790 [Slackia heliotrinireducens DSM 20476]|uniref:Uncharacterized protein n=1 Tax=Slackia heliotrinireducens (strain ATCC 29202 / DSM 20476 / NCTC 11029 / RHS 1) TaxID=471855 RepID=C7N436_SLAHD|nr:hypothetical protein Shel_27790 [Slackia heliotrinireducens DSM 20476]